MKSRFKTSDLALSAFLKLSGVELLDISPVGKRKSEFVFQDSDDRQQLVMSFFNHRGRVDPLDYMNTVKGLKAMATEAQQYDMRGTASGINQS